jgi:phosphonate transport system substrate-binding protein
MRKFFVLALVLVFALMAVSAVAAQDELGSENNPIQVYFVPSVEAQVIVEGGEVMANALNEATGLHFRSFRADFLCSGTIEAMCADPGKLHGLHPGRGYVIANNLCGVEVEAAAVRRRLAGVLDAVRCPPRQRHLTFSATWPARPGLYPDAWFHLRFCIPSAELRDAGITVGEQVEVGGHTAGDAGCSLR